MSAAHSFPTLRRGPCFACAGSVISVVDNGYTPGGAVTNGFDIQTPSAVHDGTTALSSDYTRVDGTTFTGAKGGSLVSFQLMISSAECVNIRTLTAIFDHFGEEISVGLVRYVVSVLRRSFDRLSSIFVPPRITRTCGTSSP